ncbi:G-type lectin S-receptor-like serine/threonine-protein kinase RLK1 [Bienertia sinuspersici]
MICVCLLLPFPTKAQTNINITLGLSLKARNPSSAWPSPSQDFALGFHEIESGNFLLVIWFNKIPETTITWSANRDHPAPRGSKVELKTDRGLVLTDPSGREIWKAKLQAGSSRGERIAYAAMLETGNFVLATEASAILWQSFDEPTDTLLPTQKMNQEGSSLLVLQKRITQVAGLHSSYKIQELALFTTSFLLFNALNALNNYYWAYDTKGLGHQVVFNQSGFLYLVARNGSILIDMFPDEEYAKQVLYQRALCIPELDISFKWGLVNQVLRARKHLYCCYTATRWRGLRYNSYCKIENNRKPHCICPPGYTLLDPDDEMSGCFQNFPPHSCENPAQEINQFDFKVLQDVDCPMADYEHFQWGLLEEKATSHKRENNISVERIAFIKLRTRGGFSTLIATSGSVNITLLGIIITGFSFFAYRKKNISGKYNIRSFTYKELTEATNKFNEELGWGAFRVVYKGVLYDLSGSQMSIAIKKLYALSQDTDKKFKTEVNSIGHTNHKNLVQLIGYCEEEEQRKVVYEFMSNGALSNFLYQPPKLAWEKRLWIAQGIARGLYYLHEDCSTQVIHCDVKPQNILLDDNHNARISDFGLAKLLRLDQTQTNTAPRGTRGYVAPEWFRNMPITGKVDVYSFGILFLRLFVARGMCKVKTMKNVLLLTDWAFDCYQMGLIHELVQDNKEALNDEQRLVSMVKIAIWCIQNDPNLRPTMWRVIEMLEGLDQVPEPPCPASYSISHTTGSFILQTHPASAP